MDRLLRLFIVKLYLKCQTPALKMYKCASLLNDEDGVFTIVFIDIERCTIRGEMEMAETACQFINKTAH